jgi:serine/threonine protein phosphatase PrpC
MIPWKMVSVYTIGQSHIASSTPCQDRTFELVKIDFFKSFKKLLFDLKWTPSIFYGLSLADGAGSCANSGLGADLSACNILTFVENKFEKLLDINPSQISNLLTSYLEKELEKTAKRQEIQFNTLSSTLLFIAIKNDKFIIGHIGDGVIGMLDNNNEIKVISKPENGEFSNATFFTTSTNYPDRLRILKGTLKNAVGFILMSDGPEESLYNKQDNSLLDINKDIINWLKDNNIQDVKKALTDNLKDVISKNTNDDCSIGIIRKT